MQDREFEKQVQQKMQELRFAPGSDVWARVQADLQKKKPRRPVLLWVLLAGLLISSSWFLYTGILSNNPQTAQVQPEGKESGSINNTTENKTNPEPGAETPHASVDPNGDAAVAMPEAATDASTQSGINKGGNTSREDNVNKPAVTSTERSIDNPAGTSTDRSINKPASNTSTGERINRPGGILTGENINKRVNTGKRSVPASTAVQKNPPIQNRSFNSIATQEPKKIARVDRGRPASQKTFTSKEKNVSKADADNAPKPGNTMQPDVAQQQITPKPNSNTVATEPEKADPLTNPATAKAETSQQLPPAKDSVIAMKNTTVRTQAGKPGSFQWGVSAGVGISDLGKQLFQSTTVADFAYAGPGVTPSNAPLRRPAIVESGTSFNAGGYVSQPVGKKFNLKLGLNYEYYSNRITIGSYVGSPRAVNQGASLNMVQEYYTSGNFNKFTNQFHYVSVPLSIQWKLNNHPKYGIVWENGASYARLIKTDALHYDGISGTYYKDNSVLNKTQWMVSSSVLFSLKAKGNLQLYAGPHVQYSLSNLVNNDAQNEKHLRYAGLKMMVGFNKK